MKTVIKELSEEHKQSIREGMFKYFDNKGRKGTICKNGYRLITINNRRVYEHRLVWEQHYGEIPKGYHIHHKNGNKLDNSIENLELINAKEHVREHAIHNNLGLNSVGVEPTNKTPLEIRKQIFDLRQVGTKLDDICKIVGLSYPTVQKYAKEVKLCV